MDQILAALDATWRILLVGIVLGAGLPALFAVGIRALAWGVGGEAALETGDADRQPHPLGRPIAYALFTLVIVVVIAGVGFIVAHGLGVTVTFNGIVPAFSKH